ncbi:MAG: hypothetical protein CMN85_09245 [Spongiibacteraceae bacterium]|nr:hypothetical protein [Spongiibacteraceae bacterium]|tara:strand:- start:2393 stop:3124 length:732 start_codon:yes stop_codon:yes gene_type:complete
MKHILDQGLYFGLPDTEMYEDGRLTDQKIQKRLGLNEQELARMHEVVEHEYEENILIPEFSGKDPKINRFLECVCDPDIRWPTFYEFIAHSGNSHAVDLGFFCWDMAVLEAYMPSIRQHLFEAFDSKGDRTLKMEWDQTPKTSLDVDIMLAVETSHSLLQRLVTKYLTDLEHWVDFSQEHQELLACVANTLTMALGIDILREAMKKVSDIQSNHTTALGFREAGWLQLSAGSIADLEQSIALH